MSEKPMTDALLAELQFLRYSAEMRATCDGCGRRRVMVSLHDAGKWLCFDCTATAARHAPKLKGEV